MLELGRYKMDYLYRMMGSFCWIMRWTTVSLNAAPWEDSAIGADVDRQPWSFSVVGLCSAGGCAVAWGSGLVKALNA